MSLNPQYMISPNLQEFFIDKDTGLPLADGKVFYYSDIARSDLKTVYQLSGGVGSYNFTPLPNPVDLSGVGTTTDGNGNDIRVYYYPYNAANEIELYYIVVKDSVGNTKFVRQAWPNLSQEVTTATFAYNFARNPMFSSWSNGTLYSNVKLGSSNQYDFFVDDWTYQQNDAGQTINISQGVFDPGNAEVPGNPRNYLIYENSSVGASPAQTYNRFQQYYESAQTLSGQSVSMTIWLKQTVGASGAFSATLTQYFGTGGSSVSASTETKIIQAPALSSEWTEYKGLNVLLPSVNGKVFGTNGDDALILNLNMPLNSTAKIFIDAVRHEQGESITGSAEISNDDMAKQTNTYTYYPPFTTGDIKQTLKIVADPAWAMMDDGTIGNPSSGASQTGWAYFSLYSLIWNNVHSLAYAPLYTSAGVSTTYGVSAKTDWDENKRISLTKSLGRVLAGANPIPTPIVNLIFTATPNPDNYLTVADGTFGLQTGNPVKVSNTGGALPAGLSPSDTYYVYIYDFNTIYLYTTLTGAVAGGVTDLKTFSSAGTGVNRIYTVNIARPLGFYIGEDSHASTISETAQHFHEYATFTTAPVASGSGALGINGSTNNNTGITGGSVAHNNLQPTVYMNIMIKL